MKRTSGHSKRATSKLVAIILAGALAVSLVSCSSDDGGDSGATAPTDPAANLTEEEQALVDQAQAWLDDAAAVPDATFESLVFSGLTQSPSVTHVTFAQEYDGHVVQDAEVTVHVRDGGEIAGANNALVDAQPSAYAAEEVPAD